MPDSSVPTTEVVVRLPEDVLETLAAVDRGLSQLDRGEWVSSTETLLRLDQIIEEAERRRARA